MMSLTKNCKERVTTKTTALAELTGGKRNIALAHPGQSPRFYVNRRAPGTGPIQAGFYP